jgi:general secretion pathway protein G
MMRFVETSLNSPRSVSPARSAGFTLVEILIVVVILGILAMIVVPQFSNASHTARENTLKDDLRYLRMQITVFAAQHNDVRPGYPGGNLSATPTAADFIDQMTKYTNAACAVNATMTATYKFGTYLSKPPANPLSDKDTFLIVDNSAAMPAPDDSTGWIYKPATGELIANQTGTDNHGTPYASY